MAPAASLALLMSPDRPSWKLEKSNVPIEYASSSTAVFALYIADWKKSADFWLESITAFNPLPAATAIPTAPPNLVSMPMSIPIALLKASKDLPAVEHPCWNCLTCAPAFFISDENAPVFKSRVTTRLFAITYSYYSLYSPTPSSPSSVLPFPPWCPLSCLFPHSPMGRS